MSGACDDCGGNPCLCHLAAQDRAPAAGAVDLQRLYEWACALPRGRQP